MRRLALASCLVAAVLGQARAETPVAPDPSWSIAAEVGAEFLLIEDTELGAELTRFGYTPAATGLALGIAVEHALLPWLDVGFGLGWATLSRAREDRQPKTETLFDRFTARAYAQAAYCIIDGCTRDFAIEFGAQLGLGGGATLWSLRGEASAAPHLSLDPALVWNLFADCWGVGVRLSYAFVAVGELGPLALTTALSWTPSVNARIFFRW